MPRSRASLAETMAADRLLLWTTVALLACATVPLFLSPFLPFSDMGINTAMADLMWDAATGRQPTATFYKVEWTPLPYWTTYGLCAVAGRLFGPLIAGKVLTVLVMAIVPLGTMRLLSALERDPRLGLWAFVLTWEHNLYAGWLTFLLGMGVLSFVFAWLIEAETVGDGLRVAPFAGLIGLTHVQSVWLFGAAGLALTLTTGPLRRRIPIHAAAAAGMAVSVLPWLLARVSPNQLVTSTPTFGFEWHKPAVKLSQFFAYTLDNFSRSDAERVAALGFALLVLAPVALSVLPMRGNVAATSRWSAVALLGAAIALYAWLPFSIWGPIGHWYTYPRYATMILLWLLLLPRPRLRGLAALALVPGVIAALAIDVKACEQFAAFAERTAPFRALAQQVPYGASVLPIVLDDDDLDPDLRLAPYHQFYAYVTAFNHGFSPYLWQNVIPLVYRNGAGVLPAPGWGAPVSMQQHGRFYDYIMVQGISRGDPVRDNAETAAATELVFEAARWRLYKVRH